MTMRVSRWMGASFRVPSLCPYMVRRIRNSMALPGEEGQPAESIDTQMEFFRLW